MPCDNILYNLLTEYKLKKEEEINNLKAAFEKNINTERTLKTQVYMLLAFSMCLYLSIIYSEVNICSSCPFS